MISVDIKTRQMTLKHQVCIHVHMCMQVCIHVHCMCMCTACALHVRCMHTACACACTLHAHCMCMCMHTAYARQVASPVPPGDKGSGQSGALRGLVIDSQGCEHVADNY